MNSHRFQIVRLCLAGIALLASPALGQSPPRMQRIVVLDNGQLIEGKVTQAVSQVEILTDDGSRLVLERDRVAFCCNTRSEAYWGLAARTRASDLEGQIQLFKFCLRNDLLAEAGNQIDILQMLPLKATQLEFLNRQLVVARSARERKTSEAARESLADDSELQKFATGQPAFRTLPPLDEEPQGTLWAAVPELDSGSQAIAQVDFVQELEPVAPTIPAGPSEEELERATDSIPKPAVAFFKRKIEPLVTRSCFAYGCHGPESDTMPLARLSVSRVMPRQLSQQNLYSLLRHADHYQPLESPLLKWAATAHGGADKPSIQPGSVPFENLAQWLIGISHNPFEHYPSPSWLAERDGRPAVAPGSAADTTSAAVAEAQEPAVELPPGPDWEAFEELPPALRIAPIEGSGAAPEESGAPPSPESSRDPFDPEIFHRRARGTKPPAPGGEGTATDAGQD